jgi:D-arabinose 1-dehydrogenase-like Zn-dependent alcohol dehydrogenase
VLLDDTVPEGDASGEARDRFPIGHDPGCLGVGSILRSAHARGEGEPVKAMVLREPGVPLRLEEVPVPKIGPNDALLRVRATGVGLTVVILTATPGRVTAFPRIPGHEVAGEVVEVGAEVATVKIGDRVTCHFYLTCKVCPYCRSGRETLCPGFRGNVGMACDGGYAEYMAIPAVNLCPIPPGVSDLEAAIGADAICTPLHACREEARVGPGDRVLVVGAGGGVGIHAVQMARLCGGWVLAADVTDPKLEMAQAMGADALIDGRRGDLAAQALALTDGRGVDAVIDTVASRETLEAGVRALARSGRLVIIGHRPTEVFGADPTFRVDPRWMLERALEIHGSRYVSLAEIAQTLELLRQRRIRAIVTREFPLEGAEEAHRLLRENALVGRAALLQP